MPLNPKQQRFVAEYLKDLNATQAAIRAGYSAKTARVQGPRLLQNAAVSESVAAGQAKKLGKLELDAESVLGELLRIAKVDIAQAFEEDGNLRKLSEIPEDVRRAVAGIEIDDRWEGKGEDATRYTVKKLKFWDKTRALELLAKNLNLLTERIEHSGPGGKGISISINGIAK